jgi:hypothetical protein
LAPRPRRRPQGLVWQEIPSWQPDATPILFFPSPREKK